MQRDPDKTEAAPPGWKRRPNALVHAWDAPVSWRTKEGAELLREVTWGQVSRYGAGVTPWGTRGGADGVPTAQTLTFV